MTRKKHFSGSVKPKIFTGQKPQSVNISTAPSQIILDATESLEVAQNNLRKLQLEVQEYNQSLLDGDIQQKLLAGKTFLGYDVIVRLFKDDVMQLSLLKDFEGRPMAIKKQLQVAITGPDDLRTIMIENPLPYLYEGVLVAVGHEVEEKFPGVYKPGQIVQLTWFDQKDSRYYPDKRKLDLAFSMEHVLAGGSLFPNYEGYQKVHVSLIEAILDAPTPHEQYAPETAF